MLRYLKYTFYFLILLGLSSCLSGRNKKVYALDYIKISDQLQLVFPSESYKGEGLRLEEEGPVFQLNRVDGGVRFFSEVIPENQKPLLAEFVDGSQWRLKGFDQVKQLSDSALYFYNLNNGFKDLNANGAICFNFAGDMQVVLYTAYRSLHHQEVLRIVESLSKVK